MSVTVNETRSNNGGWTEFCHNIKTYMPGGEVNDGGEARIRRDPRMAATSCAESAEVEADDDARMRVARTFDRRCRPDLARSERI